MEKSRREIMKQASMITALSTTGLSATSTAAAEDLLLGTCKFTELSVEYRGVSNQTTTVGCGGLEYLTSDGVVTLLRTSERNKSPKNIAIGYKGKIRSPSYFKNRTKTHVLPVDGTFQGHGISYVRLSNPYSQYCPKITAANKGVDLNFGDKNIHLDNGDMEEISLEKEKVHIIPKPNETEEVEIKSRMNDKTITKERFIKPDPVEMEIKPTLIARHHGVVEFFGAEDKIVVPRKSDHLLSKHYRNMKESAKSKGNLVVASKKGENV
ncbi:hypothetical protein ACFQO4_19475 [Saliphagus sp. GCM10025334]|uniref:hypothetical protein n=1 Tax=Natronosalvus caseinilyticus TaxID=2953747 RepID=UPI0028AFD5C7|nr:hypothetical protein [Natronosalvus caseinilyticus]